MPRLQIGCGPLPMSLERYAGEFDIVELSDTYWRPMTTEKLRIWRKKHRELSLIITAWSWLSTDTLDMKGTPPEGFDRRELGMLRDTEQNAKIWQRVVEQAEAGAASAVLLKTPAAFGPSVRNLDNLRRLARASLERDAFRLVWEPRGVWGEDEVDDLVAELGIVAARDPFAGEEWPAIPDDDAYYVLTAPRGSRMRFSDDDVLDLLDFVEEHHAPVTLIFRGDDRADNARLTQRLLAKEYPTLGEEEPEIPSDDELPSNEDLG